MINLEKILARTYNIEYIRNSYKSTREEQKLQQENGQRS